MRLRENAIACFLRHTYGDQDDANYANAANPVRSGHLASPAVNVKSAVSAMSIM
jgi:hypothetical protein